MHLDVPRKIVDPTGDAEVREWSRRDDVRGQGCAG
ncbi:hypothetical protein J2S48_000769 [Promicromonospora iranensis]|uniref:Uncharacterized protein n=1 Tax=Promicromonospora iranensis TaxID=1105144 RepID=A0ABU2CIV0_9MICO|nr:hypothetical protein [Promicromonospora iranensis]